MVVKNFTYNESICLINLWRELNVDNKLDLKIADLKGLYSSIADKMRKKGYNRDVNSLQRRMSKMKRTYKQVILSKPLTKLHVVKTVVTFSILYLRASDCVYGV